MNKRMIMSGMKPRWTAATPMGKTTCSTARTTAHASDKMTDHTAPMVDILGKSAVQRVIVLIKLADVYDQAEPVAQQHRTRQLCAHETRARTPVEILRHAIIPATCGVI